MEIEKIKELLPDYIQGLLSKEDAVAVKEQLAKSEPLRREYEELRSYYDAINTLKPVKAPSNFLDSVHARIALQPPLVKFVKTVFEPFHIKIPLELAGVVLTTVLVILVFNPFKKGTIPPIVFDEPEIQTEKPSVESRVVEEKTEEIVAELKDKDIEKETPPEKPVTKVKKSEDITSVTQKAVVPREPAKKAAPMPKPVVKKKTKQYAAKEDISPIPSSEATQGAGSAPTESETRDELKAELQEKIASLEGAKKGLSKPMALKQMEQPEEELYADRVIKRKDSIVLQKREPKPEPVDIGLLALSITKKEEREIVKTQEMKTSVDRRKRRSAQKSSAGITSQAAPDVAETIQPESENDIIFAQVQSTIKANKGEYTLLQDKPQKLDKRYYVVEISSENFSALRKALEKQGVVIEENFSFEEEESELIKFNLVVRID
jgi:hypothetical protein